MQTTTEVTVSLTVTIVSPVTVTYEAAADRFFVPVAAGTLIGTLTVHDTDTWGDPVVVEGESLFTMDGLDLVAKVEITEPSPETGYPVKISVPV